MVFKDLKKIFWVTERIYSYGQDTVEYNVEINYQGEVIFKHEYHIGDADLLHGIDTARKFVVEDFLKFAKSETGYSEEQSRAYKERAKFFSQFKE